MYERAESGAEAIDMRSDTVTRPSPGMREAMMGAPLGDDVFRDDPTVLELESSVANYLGKEAGVFVPSGTMSNQIAIWIQTRRGDAVLVEEKFGESHGLPKKLDVDKAMEYQQQIKEVGYGKEI